MFSGCQSVCKCTMSAARIPCRTVSFHGTRRGETSCGVIPRIHALSKQGLQRFTIVLTIPRCCNNGSLPTEGRCPLCQLTYNNRRTARGGVHVRDQVKDFHCNKLLKAIEAITLWGLVHARCYICSARPYDEEYDPNPFGNAHQAQRTELYAERTKCHGKSGGRWRNHELWRTEAAGSERSSIAAAVMPSTSSGAKRRPPSPAASGSEPVLPRITGVPLSCASIIGYRSLT